MVERTKIALGYIRVSDDDQVDGYSLDAQTHEQQRYCDRNDYRLRLFSEEGVSAKYEEIRRRPQFQALLAAAERHEGDIALVHTLDRWARKLKVQTEAFAILGRAGVGFVSISEHVDLSTPSGRLQLNVMGSVNEFFSDQLGLHVKKSLLERAQSGLNVGPVPFGFRPGQGGVALPDERELAGVREVFARRAMGESTGALSRWLNEQGFRTREGHAFTAHAIKDLLRTRFYVGVVSHLGQEYPGKHQAVLTQDLYAAVQARHRHREVIRTVNGPRGLLQGLISCGNCGLPFQSDRRQGGTPQYRERHAAACQTNERSTLAAPLDDQLGAIIKSLLLPADWRARMARLAPERPKPADPQVLKERLRRLHVVYREDGAMSDAEYHARVQDLKKQIADSEGQPECSPQIDAAAKLFENIVELWNQATPEERRQLISPLIERVYVDLEAKLIGAIRPALGFGALLGGAMGRSQSSAVLLFSDEEAERLKIWSWWRLR